MRLTALFALLAAVATAGPVGRYLGFALDRQGASIGAGRDSLHVILPPSDSVIERHRTDTTTIVAETVRMGDSAWVIRQVTNPTSEQPVRSNDQVESPELDFATSTFPFLLRAVASPLPLSGLDAGATDTSYESGDTLLCSRQVLGDSIRWLNAYRVPFNIGTAWSFGLEGTYVYDFSGDSIMDTLSVWADTCTVLDTEDVTVPYGLVPHCYKIRRTMLQCLALEQSGVPAIESSYVRTFEWYKDSLWSIKESTEASGPIYTWIFTWLHVADFVSTDVSQLTGMGYVGIAAQPRAVCHAPLTASPNPFSGLVRVSLDPFVPLPFSPLTVRVFDTQGRPVRTIAIRQSPFANRLSLTWDGRDNAGRALPAGAYFIRAADEVCPVIKVR